MNLNEIKESNLPTNYFFFTVAGMFAYFKFTAHANVRRALFCYFCFFFVVVVLFCFFRPKWNGTSLCLLRVAHKLWMQSTGTRWNLRPCSRRSSVATDRMIDFNILVNKTTQWRERATEKQRERERDWNHDLEYFQFFTTDKMDYLDLCEYYSEAPFLSD